MISKTKSLYNSLLKIICMEFKNNILPLIIIFFIFGLILIYGNISTDNKPIFQVNTLNSLSEGNFDGILSTGKLKIRGDTGIGTLNALDGEMIELNDIVYQIRSDGNVYIVNSSETIPFAEVTYFKPYKIMFINKSMNYTELEAYLNSTLPSKNMVYSFKIIGNFDYVKARSPQKQNKPYPGLNDALKTQSIFNLNNVTGSAIGFWYPAAADNINLNDYHFHFIDIKKTSGGHILDLNLKNAIVEISYTSDVKLFDGQNITNYHFN